MSFDEGAIESSVVASYRPVTTDLELTFINLGILNKSGFAASQ